MALFTLVRHLHFSMTLFTLYISVLQRPQLAPLPSKLDYFFQACFEQDKMAINCWLKVQPKYASVFGKDNLVSHIT